MPPTQVVTVLIDLYYSTSGQNWLNSSNWLSGEPCQDAWYGVFCCPNELPYLDLSAQQCTSVAPYRRRLLGTFGDGSTPHHVDAHGALGALSRTPLEQASALAPGVMPPHLSRLDEQRTWDLVHGQPAGRRSLGVEESAAYCQSTITGYDGDIAPCVVTQLLLGSNNLVGSMTFDVPTQWGGADLASFPADQSTWEDMRNLTFYLLANVDLGHNDLFGAFPFWLTELPYLASADLSASLYDYSDSVAAAIAGMCGRSTMDCSSWSESGMPPVSCTAFGDGFALLEPERLKCYDCPEPSYVAGLWWVLFGGFILLAALYTWMVRLSLARIGWGVPLPAEPATIAKAASHSTPSSPGSHASLASPRTEPASSARDGSPHRSGFHSPRGEQAAQAGEARHGISVNTLPMKRWVAGSIILILQLHTLIVASSVRAHYPSAVQALVACLSLDYTCFSDPSCLLDSTPTLARNRESQLWINVFLCFCLLLLGAVSIYLDANLRPRTPTELAGGWFGSRYLYDRYRKTVDRVPPERKLQAAAAAAAAKKAAVAAAASAGEASQAASDKINEASQAAWAKLPTRLRERGLQAKLDMAKAQKAAGEGVSVAMAKAQEGLRRAREFEREAVVKHPAVMSEVAFVCSVLSFLTISVTLRVIRQLFDFNSGWSIFLGICLLALQPLVWLNHAQDAWCFMRAHKADAETSRAGMVRSAFMLHAFKHRRADWMWLNWIRLLLLLFCAWVGAIGGTIYGTAITNDAAQLTGIVLVIAVLGASWGATSLTEPYEYTFLNTLDSRLCSVVIVYLFVAMFWKAVSDYGANADPNYYNRGQLQFETRDIADFAAALVLICMPGCFLLGVVGLLVGLRASSGVAGAWNGLVFDAIPIWLRGARWGELPLFPGAVGIISLHAHGFEAAPTAAHIIAALQASITGRVASSQRGLGGTRSESDIADAAAAVEEELNPGRRRELALAIEAMIDELIREQHGRKILDQVVRFGAKQTRDAHHRAYDRARSLVLEQVALADYGQPTFTKGAPVNVLRTDGSWSAAEIVSYEAVHQAYTVRIALTGHIKTHVAPTELRALDPATADVEQRHAAVHSATQRHQVQVVSRASAQRMGLPTLFASPEGRSLSANPPTSVIGAPAAVAAAAVAGAPGGTAATVNQPWEGPLPPEPLPAPEAPRRDKTQTRRRSYFAPAEASPLPAISDDAAANMAAVEANAAGADQSDLRAAEGLTAAALAPAISEEMTLPNLLEALGNSLRGLLSPRDDEREATTADSHAAADSRAVADSRAATDSRAAAAPLSPGSVDVEAGQASRAGSGDGGPSTAAASTNEEEDAEEQEDAEEEEDVEDEPPPHLADEREVDPPAPTPPPSPPAERASIDLSAVARELSLARRRAAAEGAARPDLLVEVQAIAAARRESRRRRAATSPRTAPSPREPGMVAKGKGKQAAKKGAKVRQVVLERDPAVPPAAPKRPIVDPARRQRFVEKQIKWYRSAPAAVSDDQAEGIQTADSAWPRAASRHEPSSQELDAKMQHVATVCHKFNYGLQASGTYGASSFTPLIDLGYSMHLCCHQHRNARTSSSRARLIWQKFYIVLVDWAALAKQPPGRGSSSTHREGTRGGGGGGYGGSGGGGGGDVSSPRGTSPPLVIANEWLGRWNGRRLRVNEPVYSGGGATPEAGRMRLIEERGRAVVYDSDFSSVVVLPAGAAARLLHRDLEETPTPAGCFGECTAYYTDVGCCDGPAVLRAALRRRRSPSSSSGYTTNVVGSSKDKGKKSSQTRGEGSAAVLPSLRPSKSLQQVRVEIPGQVSAAGAAAEAAAEAPGQAEATAAKATADPSAKAAVAASAMSSSRLATSDVATLDDKAAATLEPLAVTATSDEHDARASLASPPPSPPESSGVEASGQGSHAALGQGSCAALGQGSRAALGSGSGSSPPTVGTDVAASPAVANDATRGRPPLLVVPAELNQVTCSARVLLEQLVSLLGELDATGGSAPGTPWPEAERLEMSDLLWETATALTHPKASLERLARLGRFPRQLRTSTGRALSLHLCASQTDHLFGDTARESLVWLTIVDLAVHNPVDQSRGGFLTPMLEPYDARKPLVVPGEVRRGWTSLAAQRDRERDESRRVQELQKELSRMQSRRLDAFETHRSSSGIEAHSNESEQGSGALDSSSSLTLSALPANDGGSSGSLHAEQALRT